MARRAAKGRLATIAELSQAEDARAVAALTEAANDSDEEICRAGLVALADRSALGPVADVALRSRRPAARAIAVELLVDAPEGATAALASFLEPGDLARDADRTLMRVLRAASDDNRRAAADLAAGATGDEARQVRAADVLGALREASATPALVAMLHDGGPAARAAAAAALGQIQDPRAAQSLVAATSDADAEVSAAARQALAGMGRAATYAFATLPGTDAQDFADSVGALLENPAPEARAVAPAPEAPAEATHDAGGKWAPAGAAAAAGAATGAEVAGGRWSPPEEPPQADPAEPASGGDWSLPPEAVAAPAAATAVPAPRPQAPPRRRRPALLAAAAAGLVTLIVVAVLALSSGDEPAPTRTAAQAVPSATPEGQSPAEARAAEKAANRLRRATESTHRRLTAQSRAAFRRRQAALRRQREARAAALRAAAARRAAARVATPAPTAASTPAPVRTAQPVVTAAPPAPTAAPPKPQPTARPQPTPQVTQPDPIP